MRYDNLMFDLDGTLTESGLGIVNSVAYALEKKGISDFDRKALYRFVGPPLKESFARYFGLTEEEIRVAIDDYHVYFADKGIYENELIDGAMELLEGLKRGGHRITVVTSKPEVFAVKVLKNFGLDRYVDSVYGATLDESLSKKCDILRVALKEVDDRRRCVMIGDRDQDIDGATQNGIDSIGVLCGYGDRTELEGAGATYIVDRLDEIPAIVDGKDNEKQPGQ